MADIKSVLPYDLGAEVYDAHVSDPNDSTYHSYYEKPAIRAVFGDLSNKKILNIGCGSAVDTQWLVENGSKDVTGIDLSAGLIAIGQKKFPDLDLRVMDMEALEFADESFDLAVSSLAIHYLDNWTTALKEAHRVLRRGGRYVFSCNHPVAGAVSYSNSGNHRNGLMGKSKNIVTGEVKYFGDYMKINNLGVGKTMMPIGGLEVTTYTQTFSNMVRYIVDSGFTIESVVEPLPQKSLIQADNDTYDKLNRFPYFIIWELRK